MDNRAYKKALTPSFPNDMLEPNKHFNKHLYAHSTTFLLVLTMEVRREWVEK